MPLFKNRISQINEHKSLADIDLGKSREVVNFVEHRWKKRNDWRYPYERQWMVNTAMFLGFQYLEFDDSWKSLRQPVAPPWRVRLVANRLQGTVRKITSKVLRQRPQWIVVPATEETEDEFTALVSEKILRYFWRTQKLDETLVEALNWMSVTGNAFLRVFWDPTKGEEFTVEKSDLKRGEEIFRETINKGDKRRKIPDSVSARMGNVTVEVCSPFEFDPDPNATRLEDCSYLVQSKLRTREYMSNQYGVDLQPSPKDDEVMSVQFQNQIAALSGPSGMTSINQRQDEDLVLEHSLYVRPTNKYPKGFFGVVGGGRLLRHGALELGEMPFVHLKEIHVPGRFWGTCALEQAIPLQIGYNRARSQIVEAVNLMSRPKYLNPQGSGILNANFTSEPGEVIEYILGMKPEMMKIEALPNYVMQNLDQFLNDFNDVTGLHEVSHAKVPGGVRAGVAIAQLQEQDDSLLAPMLMLIEDSLSQLGSWTLKLLAANVTEERLIKIVGKNREIETLKFKGKELFGKNDGKPGVNYFDVQVQMGSQLPFSKAARQQFVIEMVQFGILNPERERDKILEMLQIGNEEAIIDEAQKERANAHRENMLLAHVAKREAIGFRLDVNPWDIDELHVASHRNFQRGPDYAKLRAKSPIIPELGKALLDQLFEDHIQRHVQRASAAQQALPAPQGPAPTPQAPQPNEGLQGLAELIATQGAVPGGV